MVSLAEGGICNFATKPSIALGFEPKIRMMVHSSAVAVSPRPCMIVPLVCSTSISLFSVSSEPQPDRNSALVPKKNAERLSEL